MRPVHGRSQPRGWRDRICIDSNPPRDNLTHDGHLKMAQGQSRRTATDPPKSAARFVRRGAQAIRARSEGISQYRAEYRALVEWARETGRLFPFDFIEQFSFIGDGAEHRVYKSESENVAIKATLPNKFGYSTLREGHWASPLEYLKRLAWQNLIFGDEIRLIGVAYDDDQMEVYSRRRGEAYAGFRGFRVQVVSFYFRQHPAIAAGPPPTVHPFPSLSRYCELFRAYSARQTWTPAKLAIA